MAWSYDDEFRRKATLRLAVTSLAFMIPFTAVHFVMGRYLLGGACLAIVFSLGANSWVSAKGRYSPKLTLFVLLPVVLVSLGLSFQLQGVVGALWCFPAIIVFYFMLPERLAWVSSSAIIGLAVPAGLAVLPGAVVARLAATLAAVSVFSAIFVRIIGAQQRELREQALTDPLTGLSNRTHLTSSLQQAVERHRRSGTPMAILTVDLDHFKNVNDTLGHDAGDRLLKSVGQLLQGGVRRSDQVFRLGGEEFLVVLYATNLGSARSVAEKTRQAIAEIAVLPARRVTASIGVAELQRDEDWMAWMKRCDEKVYQAKSEGRDRVAA